jgi:hypothetical protein
VFPLRLLFPETDPAVPILRVYKENIPAHYGRAEKRGEIIEYKLDEFSLSETFMIESSEGMLTAVVLDTAVVEKLESLFIDYDEIYIDPYWLEKNVINGRTTYLYYDGNSGTQFLFSPEKPGREILEEVDIVYRDDPYWREEVGRHYRENYVIRIFSAENIIDYRKIEITFTEALLMATLIADRDQWLWGMHDGVGMLEKVIGFSLPETEEPENKNG